MSKSALRIKQIETILKERTAITIKELSNYFGVSEMTIRRDLTLLKDDPHISNIRGLIVYNSLLPDPLQYDIGRALDTRVNEKIRIGQKAATMVEENDVIMIDLGSTTEYLAKAIPQECNATAFCVSYNALVPLTKLNNMKVYCLGGFFHPDTLMFEGNDPLLSLKNMRAQKLFASAAGVHHQLGVTCANSYEAPIKKALINSCAERILLIDSTKFGVVQPTYIANIDQYNTIITDTGLSPEWEKYLKQFGIKVIKV